jgi:pimeloyl-ACP methyl ester carboxylesterase
MAEDLQTILRALESFGKKQTAGAFHSLSSIVSLLHVLRYGFAWDGLILFDPPLAPPPGHPLHCAAVKFELALSNWARQRQREFRDTYELAAYFERKRRTRRWLPGAAELMARAITRPGADGKIELVCPPEFEADIYVQNAQSAAWSALPAMASELLVVSSDYDGQAADPPGLVCRALRSEFGVDVVPIPGAGHLLQIERPAEAEAVVRSYLRARGFEIAEAVPI